MNPPPHHDSTHHDSISHGSISHGLTCHDVQTTLLFASLRYKIDVVEWHQRTIDELIPVRTGLGLGLELGLGLAGSGFGLGLTTCTHHSSPYLAHYYAHLLYR